MTKQIDKLVSVLRDEHGGCEQNSCDISQSLEHGYGIWAVQLFKWSGAASDKFEKIYKTLPKGFEKIAESERKQFVKVPHATCPDCNAVIWNIDEIAPDENIYCDSCDSEFKPAILAKVKRTK